MLELHWEAKAAIRIFCDENKLSLTNGIIFDVAEGVANERHRQPRKWATQE